MTETIEEMLIRHEGFVPHAYQDSEGYWTIGIGTLIDKRKGGGITKEEALYLCRNRIKRCEEDLDRNIRWWRNLTPERQNVLLDMCFNMGIGNSHKGLLSFQRTLDLISIGKYKEAAKAMLESRWASQVGGRAIELSKIMAGE